MQRLLPLLIAFPALLAAAETPADRAFKKAPAISMLPDGSVLDEVVLPRYDARRNLLGVLRAQSLTLVNDEHIAGEDVVIELFNPDRSPRGRIDLNRANFNQAKGYLEARETVDLRTDRLTAKGSGLLYDFAAGEGFLLGPATTWLTSLPATTMHAPASPLRTAALAGLSLVTSPLVAAPPPPLSAAETAALQADVASRAPDAAQAVAAAQQELDQSLAASSTAGEKAAAFRERTDLAASEPSSTPAEPNDDPPGPTDTVISSDGGMYFDTDEGVLVYQKNVRVADPRFTLNGADELKIFFAAPPAAEAGDAKAAPKNRDAASLGGGIRFGDVERIVATGKVRVLQKETDGKDPVEASGAIFSYNLKSELIIISGGYPWVKRGGFISRAKTANQNLRITRSGEFNFNGQTETILPLGEMDRNR